MKHRTIHREKYHSIKQVCEILGVSRVTVWRWIRNKKLPAIRLGSRTKPLVRIAESELETFIKSARS